MKGLVQFGSAIAISTGLMGCGNMPIVQQATGKLLDVAPTTQVLKGQSEDGIHLNVVRTCDYTRGLVDTNLKYNHDSSGYSSVSAPSASSSVSTNNVSSREYQEPSNSSCNPSNLDQKYISFGYREVNNEAYGKINFIK